MARGGGESARERFGEAAGLAQARPGFCFSADHDALFALGWPHLRFVVDGHREDEDPPEGALRVLEMGEPPARLAWPRRVAQGLVRAWGLPSVFELAPATRRLREGAREAVWCHGPLSPDEVAAMLLCRLTQDGAGLPERAIETFVLLLEALVGVEPVGNAIVEGLEQLDPDLLLARWTLPPVVTWNLGFLLLRAPAPVAAAWRARLRGVLDRALDARPALRRQGLRMVGSSHARALHLVLDGASAAEASSDHTLRWYAHVTDDPVLVRMRVAMNRLAYEPDARLVFLGGNDVLARFARDWPRLATTDGQRWFFEQVAPIRAPEIYPLMLDLAGRSLVRDLATAWFRAHAEDAEPFLAQVTASSTPAAGWARSVRNAIA